MRHFRVSNHHEVNKSVTKTLMMPMTPRGSLADFLKKSALTDTGTESRTSNVLIQRALINPRSGEQ